MSITKNTNTQSALDTLTDDANQRFIDAADAQIAAAISQGLYSIGAVCWEEKIDPKAIYEYYSNLGYSVEFPDFPQTLLIQPANLFGQFWINFWTNGNVPVTSKKPLRFLISWN